MDFRFSVRSVDLTEKDKSVYHTCSVIVCSIAYYVKWYVQYII